MAEYSPSKIIKDGNTYNFRDTTKIPLSGSNQISGDLIPATDNAYNLGDSTYGFASFYVNKLYLKGSTIFNVVDDNYICVGGATAQANGANLVLNGKNRSTSAGEFKLEARDGTYTRQLIGKPDGTLSWNNKNVAMQEDVVPRSGGAVLSGTDLARTVNNSELALNGGGGWSLGSRILLTGKDRTGNGGSLALITHNGSDVHYMWLNPNGSWTWDGSACVVSSDSRLKDEISPISDDVLDAWENLEPKQYKYKSDLENDKENAQVHYGWIAQDVESIIKGDRKGEVKNGLWLHESWEEQEEVSHEGTYTEESQTKDGVTKTVTKTRKVIDQPYRAKGDSYGLRYTECLVVECAFLRKKNKELQEQLDKLSARLDKLESASSK